MMYSGVFVGSLSDDDWICVLVCCLGELSCTGYCQQLGGARSWTHVEAFMGVLN